LPRFPEEARRAGVLATVTVRYVVREDGSVTDVVIVRGHPLLDAEVVRAVSAWRFSPATLDGRPVRVVRFAKLPFRPRL
ncbi:MAG TPA: energy transducer TonB, partial [Polyangiaceae bacterium]|nr:energy transducer TonB [Polyangiaceae bacterium]